MPKQSQPATATAGLVNLVVKVPEAWRTHLKVRAAERRETMAELVTRAVDRELRRKVT